MLVERQTPRIDLSSLSALSASNPLVARMNDFVCLLDEERMAVQELCVSHLSYRAGQTVVHQGARTDRICLVLSGVAFRYRWLPNGRRQIFGYLLPGDLCDTNFAIHNQCDHNVGLLCDTQVAMISTQAFTRVRLAYPRIHKALQMMSLMDSAMLREWLLNVAQRDAAEKLAHLFCELRIRFSGPLQGGGVQGYNIPLTQIDLADTLGLTSTHINRIMQQFRRMGLIHWSRKHFDILDYPRLQQLAGFDPSYLLSEKMRDELKVAA